MRRQKSFTSQNQLISLSLRIFTTLNYAKNPLDQIILGMVESRLRDSSMQVDYLIKSFIFAASILMPGPMVVETAIPFR
jgi:hypothetical protein